MSLEEKLKILSRNTTFKKLQSTYTNYSPFSFQPLQETGVSEFVAWSLNPREAHKGLVFCREFVSCLLSSLENNDQMKNKSAIEKKLRRLDENPDLWKNAIIKTEHSFGDKVRCDILIWIPTDTKPIWLAIENKIKANITTNQDSSSQLSKYRTNIQKDLKAEDPILVLMDASDRELLTRSDYKNERKYWLRINYNWLGSAIEEQLTFPNSAEVNFSLKSILTALEDYLPDELDPSNFYWSKAYKDVETLGKEYSKIWESTAYRSLYSKLGTQYLSQNEHLDFSAKLIMENLELFEALQEYSFMSKLESPDYELETGPVNSWAYTGDLREFEAKRGSGTHSYWAVCIWIKKLSHEKEEEPKFRLALSFAPGKRSWDPYQKQVHKYFSQNENKILPKTRDIEKEDLPNTLKKVMDRFRSHTEEFEKKHPTKKKQED